MPKPIPQLRRARTVSIAAVVAVLACSPLDARAQAAPAKNEPAPTLPQDFVIGADDVLSVVFWREKDLSAEVVVRPDGKISLPLLNEMVAAGLTPQQLRDRIIEDAKAFVKDPEATVVVKEINSRRVFVTGEVEKPGVYQLTSRLSVLQLIAMAGGLKEYAKKDRIVVLRLELGREVRHHFDYNKVLEGKEPTQNLELRPGDTVVVP